MRVEYAQWSLANETTHVVYLANIMTCMWCAWPIHWHVCGIFYFKVSPCNHSNLLGKSLQLKAEKWIPQNPFDNDLGEALKKVHFFSNERPCSLQVFLSPFPFSFFLLPPNLETNTKSWSENCVGPKPLGWLDFHMVNILKIDMYLLCKISRVLILRDVLI